MKFRGIIVEESLIDNRILNDMAILKMHISSAENKSDRWHLFEVEIDENEIENISKQIIDGWYTLFWHGLDVIAVFANKTFRFNYLDKETWKETLEENVPQIRKGGNFVFGWSIIKKDFSIQFPKEAIDEYDICSEGKIFLISGSKTTGGFAVSKKTLMEKTIFNNIFLENNELGKYKTKEGDFIQYKGRKYTWITINNEGKIFLNKNILDELNLKIDNKLLSI